MSTKWQGPSTNAAFATAGGLFTSLAGVCAPAEEKPHKVLVALEESVTGKTPGRVLEDMNAGMDKLASAGAKYGVCATGYAKLASAMATWTKDAPTDEHLNGLIDRWVDAARKFDDAVGRLNFEDPEIDRLRDTRDDAHGVVSEQEAKRVAADQTLTDTLKAIETWISSSAQSIGIPADVLKGRDSSPSVPGASAEHGAPPNTPRSVPQPSPSPRMSPSGTTPGAGDLPGTAAKDPAAKAALAKLLAENPSNAQVQLPQQAQPTAVPTMSSPGTQAKPTEKGKSESPLDKLLREAGITPPSDAPDLVAGVVPGASAAAPAPAAAVNPPAPKAQVGGSSYSNGQTTANVSGGQNRTPMTLASAVPVQETVSAGQRTGAQQTPMGQGGLPMGQGLGGQPQQSSGKEQARVQLYIKKSETELVASGAYAVAEAVRGGTICRGDHVDPEEPKNSGPRTR
ncbi:MAG: hypothetical protein KDB70_20100 [Mycobacterium sp.]|nr:hypothetical protein [Mycobacterium sp.]